MKFAWARWAVAVQFTLSLSVQPFVKGHTAVEGKRLGVLLGLLGAGVGVGVLDAGVVAAGHGQEDVQGVDEEGGRGGRDDVAVNVSIDIREVRKG